MVVVMVVVLLAVRHRPAVLHRRRHDHVVQENLQPRTRGRYNIVLPSQKRFLFSWENTIFKKKKLKKKSV